MHRQGICRIQFDDLLFCVSSDWNLGPAESPIQNLHEDTAYMLTPPSTGVQQPTISNVAQRRRTISDYRSQVNTSSVAVTADSNTNSGGKMSSLKNATKSLATGLSRFTAKRMVRSVLFSEANV